MEKIIGIMRAEENVFAVKKLMPESLLNFKISGTTLSYDELLIAWENTIIDKVATVPTARNRKIDTGAPMGMGMAAKDDGDNLTEGDQRIMYLALQAV